MGLGKAQSSGRLDVDLLAAGNFDILEHRASELTAFNGFFWTLKGMLWASEKKREKK